MTQHNYNDSIEACAAHYGDEAEAVKTYMQEGLKQALRLPNRGPIQFLKNGALHPEIREAYSNYGFYVFEGVVTAQEMSDVRQDIDELRSRFATHPDSKLDARGRPATGARSSGRTRRTRSAVTRSSVRPGRLSVRCFRIPVGPSCASTRDGGSRQAS